MLDYYKLFDYCKKISEDKNLKKERHRKNKESKQKKQLFKLIIENAYNNIKSCAENGKDYAIIYDSEYDKLIEELLDLLIVHFKPFNVIYKKKDIIDRGIFEVLKDESNYILIVDWNTNEFKSNNCDECIKQNTNNDIISNQLNNKTDKEICDEINNKTDKEICNEINNIKNEENDKTNKINKENKKDTFLEKLGFEAIF